MDTRTQDFMNQRRRARFAVRVGRIYVGSAGAMTDRAELSGTFGKADALAVAATLDGAEVVSHFDLYAAGVLRGLV